MALDARCRTAPGLHEPDSLDANTGHNVLQSGRYRMKSPLGDPAGHAATCSTALDLLERTFDRRRFLWVTGAGLAAAALMPGRALAQIGKYEAMVLSCIDPRFQEPVCKYTTARNLTGKYSHFVIAGAAVGVVAPAFKDWHKTFWDNLDASIQLHGIGKVIAINHRDCGAAKIA